MDEKQSIEKYNAKGFSPHYTLEFSLSCKNCGGSKGRWIAASDGATSFDFLLTTCEYCGVFRFEVTVHARFYDNRDADNLAKHKKVYEVAKRIDEQARKRVDPPREIVVKGERLISKCPECKEPHEPLDDGMLCHCCTS